MKLFMLTLIFSLSAIAEGPLKCGKSLTLSAGTFVEQENASTSSYDKFLKAKLTFVAQNLSKNAPIKFTLLKGTTNNCSYYNNRLALELTFKTTKNWVNIELSKRYSVDTNNDELSIYTNQLVVTTKVPRNAYKMPVQFQGPQVSTRFHYYYTCGFIDCSERNDQDVELGRLMGLALSMN